MKKFLMSFACAFGVLSLAGCNASTENMATVYELPPGLEDCSIHRLRGKGMEYSEKIIVVRCPNSETTTTSKSGKSSVSATVIH